MAQEFDEELVNNHQQRLPCVLILDTSLSMRGDPIKEMEEGIKLFEKDIKSDDDAKEKVDIMIIKCGGDKAEILVDWVNAENFKCPELSANGTTPMGGAVTLASNEIDKRRQEYRDHGISNLKPWVYIISEG